MEPIVLILAAIALLLGAGVLFIMLQQVRRVEDGAYYPDHGNHDDDHAGEDEDDDEDAEVVVIVRPAKDKKKKPSDAANAQPNPYRDVRFREDFPWLTAGLLFAVIILVIGALTWSTMNRQAPAVQYKDCWDGSSVPVTAQCPAQLVEDTEDDCRVDSIEAVRGECKPEDPAPRVVDDTDVGPVDPEDSDFEPAEGGQDRDDQRIGKGKMKGAKRAPSAQPDSPFATGTDDAGEEEDGAPSMIGDTYANAEAPDSPDATTPAQQGASGKLAEDVQKCYDAEKCELVDVLYGTNRIIDESQPLQQVRRGRRDAKTPFTNGLDDNLNLGALRISVPMPTIDGGDRKVGKLTAPNKVFGVYIQRLNAEKHFVFVDHERLARGQFIDRLDEVKSAFVYIHGYNEPMKVAAMRAAQMKVDYRLTDQPIIFSWPTEVIESLTEPQYQASREKARASREKFGEFLELIREETDIDVIHVIAHSMGNYLALPELADHHEAKPASPTAATFGKLILAAPDVERSEFQDWMLRSDGLFDHRTVYASSKDLAMDISRSFFVCRRTDDDLCRPRAGDITSRYGPVVGRNYDSIDVSAIEGYFDIDDLYGHGYVAQRFEILEDVAGIIRRNLTNVLDRRALATRVDVGDFHYWVYHDE